MIFPLHARGFSWLPTLNAAGTTSPSKNIPGSASSLIQEILVFFAFPPQYSLLVEWCIRIGLASLVLLLTTFLARRKRIERIVAWIDERVGFIELKDVDRRMFAFLISTATWVFGVMVLLGILKLNALLATLGVSAGALATIAAFANRDFLGHFFAGFALQARGQIQPGNAISVLGISGILQHIGIASCQIQDFQGVIHFIPNTKMLSEKLTNYSMADHRRIHLQCVVQTDPHNPKMLEELQQFAEQFLEEIPHKIEDKEGFVRFGAISEKGIELNIYAYTTPDDFLLQRSQALAKLKQKIDESPYIWGIPQQNIHLQQTHMS